jgi:hypothetical protein
MRLVSRVHRTLMHVEQCVNIKRLTGGDESLLYVVQSRRFGKHGCFDFGYLMIGNCRDSVGQKQLGASSASSVVLFRTGKVLNS